MVRHRSSNLQTFIYVGTYQARQLPQTHTFKSCQPAAHHTTFQREAECKYQELNVNPSIPSSRLSSSYHVISQPTTHRKPPTPVLVQLVKYMRKHRSVLIGSWRVLMIVSVLYRYFRVVMELPLPAFLPACLTCLPHPHDALTGVCVCSSPPLAFFFPLTLPPSAILSPSPPGFPSQCTAYVASSRLCPSLGVRGRRTCVCMRACMRVCVSHAGGSWLAEPVLSKSPGRDTHIYCAR